MQSARLLCPWDSPGKIPGVGCHGLLMIHKINNNKDLPCSVGNSAQYSVIAHMGIDSKAGDICTHKADSFCCTPEPTQLFKSTLLQQQFKNAHSLFKSTF